MDIGLGLLDMLLFILVVAEIMDYRLSRAVLCSKSSYGLCDARVDFDYRSLHRARCESQSFLLSLFYAHDAN